MLVGLILVGTILGSVAGGAALLLGASAWTALLIHAATGAVTVLGLAAHRALRPKPKARADPAAPRALAPPQRS